MLLHGYLDLMLASILVFKLQSDHKDIITLDVIKLLDKARETFISFEHTEGQAETSYVEAMLKISCYKKHIENSGISPQLQLKH